MTMTALLRLQREIALKQSKIRYRQDFMYELELDDQQEELSLFCKNVSYGKGSVESDSKKIGSGAFNEPISRPAGSITAVFFDDERGDISNSFKARLNKIFNPDGTQNLPVDYVFKIRIYRLLSSTEKVLDGEWRVYVEEVNDLNGDNEATAERGTFSVTFRKRSSIGNNK